jgi:hypothetical protein
MTTGTQHRAELCSDEAGAANDHNFHGNLRLMVIA